jgi:exopolyphosphatase/guanosine-5'-triphosphate,3'-diphosphate pyrophosphatase
MGCHMLLEAGDGPAMIFDIGGGSTELVLVETRAGERANASTIGIRSRGGSSALTESCGTEPPTRGAPLAYAKMRADWSAIVWRRLRIARPNR